MQLVGTAVFPEILAFIQCMLNEMDAPKQWITLKYELGVGGRRAGDCKHLFKLRVISGFLCDRNYVPLGCYVAYS